MSDLVGRLESAASEEGEDSDLLYEAAIEIELQQRIAKDWREAFETLTKHASSLQLEIDALKGAPDQTSEVLP